MSNGVLFVLESSGGSLNAGPVHGRSHRMDTLPRIGEKVETGNYTVVVVDIIHKTSDGYVVLKVK